MELVFAILPVLLLIFLMAVLKMSGDKSSVISLGVTILVALFAFSFPVKDLFSVRCFKSCITHLIYHCDGDIQLQRFIEDRKNGNYQRAIFFYIHG